MNATQAKDNRPIRSNRKTVCELVYGDLVFSTLHGRYVRFVRREGVYVVVCDRNTLKELPDYCHETQVQAA